MRGMFFGGLASVLVMVLMLLPDVPLVSAEYAQTLAQNTEGYPVSPQHPAIDARDNYVYTVYEAYNPSTATTNIAIRYSSDHGRSWGPQYWVAESASTQCYPDIKVVPHSGEIHIVWEEHYTLNGLPYQAVAYRNHAPGPITNPNSPGSQWGSTIFLRTTNQQVGLPKLAADKVDFGGNSYKWIHVVWEEDVDPTTAVQIEIKYMESDDNGVTWSSTATISSIDSVNSKHPAIACSYDVNTYTEYWYAVWQDDMPSNSEVCYARGISTPHSEPGWEPYYEQNYQISNAYPNSAEEPDIAAYVDTITVVWQQPVTTTSGEVWYRQCVNNYGTTWGSIAQLTPSGYPRIDLSTSGPAVDADDTKIYVVMIQYDDTSEQSESVYQTIYNYQPDNLDPVLNRHGWHYDCRIYPPTNTPPNAYKKNYPDVAAETSEDSSSTVYKNGPYTWGHIVFEQVIGTSEIWYVKGPM
ncbi:MAG: hypothetical protein DRN42_05250 [Thermoplasmata archaeon]|nr:MAG: hypothetical protein DRN42_05250 [Thermoplasmata archaeon]